MKWAKRLMVLPLFGLSSCAPVSGPDERQYLTPRELNSNSDFYDGREVVVRGYVLLGTNARSLYQSRQRFSQWEREWEANRPDFDPREYDADCLTLLNARTLLENRELFEDQTITVLGTFEKDYLDGAIADLQACAGSSALVLDESDVQRLLRSLP